MKTLHICGDWCQWVKGSVSLLQTSPNTAKRCMNLRLVMLAMSVKFES